MSDENTARISTANLSFTNVAADVHPIPSTAPSWSFANVITAAPTKVHSLPVQTTASQDMQMLPNQFQLPVILRNSILNEVLLRLPALFEEFLDQNERSYMSEHGSAPQKDSAEIEALQKDMREIKKQGKSWENKIKGYETKLEVWTDTVKGIDTEVTVMESKIEDFTKHIKQMEKTLTNKTKEFNNIQNKLKKTWEETEKTRTSLKKSIDDLETIDGKKL